MFLDGSKSRKYFSEKGHPRNMSVKIFQNLTSRFRGEAFLRISSSPYSAGRPHSPEPCFWTIESLRTNFEKGHPWNVAVKLFQYLTRRLRGEEFLRISSCPYSVTSPRSLDTCFLTDQNFVNKFQKRITKGTSL